MMGCHTCGGTVTGPVGTAPERAKESMFTPCVVVPTVEIWRIGPVFPEKKTLYPRVISIPVVSPSSENIALPVAFLTASCSQLPASRSPPCVQARKGAGYHKNSSTEAKIQNDRKRNVDRAVFGGGRYDRGRCERRASIVKTCACRDRGDKEVGTARVFLTDSIINCPP